jgi:hypothetical protein
MKEEAMQKDRKAWVTVVEWTVDVEKMGWDM